MSQPWFEVVSGSELQQGDVIRRCPVPVIPSNWLLAGTASASEDVTAPIVEIKLETYNVIVLSQSCDLVNRKLKSVLVCPFWSLEELPRLTNDNALISETKRRRGLHNSIRQGYSPRFHMLESCDLLGHEQAIVVIDFWTVYTVPFVSLESIVGQTENRLRLISPYVEHLSQAFARFIMRVGLPSPIAEFT